MSTCDTCSLRERYDKNPHSLLGRLWRWHIRFCPGWKQYMASRSPEERAELKKQYQLRS